MTYALTFATRAAFDTALASGGSIYTLMQGVTSAKPSVSITAHVTETGETFACGTNVMVDIKSVGPGDYVLYDSTNKKFFGIASKWIDNNYPSQPTQHTLIFKESVLASRFVVCGTVIKRFGNRIRIAGVQASKPGSSTNTSDYAWNVATLTNYTTVVKKDGGTTNTFCADGWRSYPSTRYQEDYFTANPSAGSLPCTRAEWNTLITGMTSHAPNATITVNSKTVTPADFDYDYDKFLQYYYKPKFPVATGALADLDGRENTRKIVTAFVDTLGKISSDTDVSYAAGYCYNYSVNAPGLGRTQWFLGVLKDVAEVRPLTHTLKTAIAWRSGYLWSSTQYSSSRFWYMNYYGTTLNTSKYAALNALPLAELILTT